MQKKQKYPIGIQSFSEIRTGGYEYIDKTAFIYRLVDSGKYYFLSRPRRFGKSLLIETLKSFFQGRKDLFSGLYIEDKIAEWKSYPIIHISFTNLGFETLGLEKGILKVLGKIAKQEELVIEEENVGLCFQELIEALKGKYKEKVVILIDEYDTPIVHYLPNDIEQAEQNKEILKSFYSVVKKLDNEIQFFLLTGITQFSKMSLFSTLNNLLNISMSPKYAALCGYTEAEILEHFGDKIREMASKEGITETTYWAKIKHWYNGFNFAIKDGIPIYNPFSILNLMESGVFSNYWFESGTPTFLVKMLRKDFHYQIDNIEMSMNRIRSFELDNIDYGTLLYQTGYITIKKNLSEDGYFLMGYPNWEVKDSMLQWLLGEYASIHFGEAEGFIFELRECLKQEKFARIETIMRSFFATIPADLFKSSLENFYHAIVILMFELLGCKMQAEVGHANGRTDAVAETDHNIYLFEFKFNRSATAAINYIYKQQYFLPHLHKNKPIFLVGVNFSEKARGIAHFKIEPLKEALIEN